MRGGVSSEAGRGPSLRGSRRSSAGRLRPGSRRYVSGGGVLPSGGAVLLGLALALAFSPLGAQDPIPLDTLRVQVGSRASGSLPLLTRSVRLLDRAVIEALPVRTISGLLEWATGVEILSRSPAQSDLSLRGAGFEAVVVLVDGVRVSDPQTGHHDLDLTVPLDRVERIELLRGPASALYGADAVGGVVNVVTRRDGPAWQARAEGGSWGSARFGAAGSAGDAEGTAFDAGGEWARSDGHRPGTDHETLLLNAGAGRPLGGGRLRVDAGVARRDFGAQDFYAPYPSFERTRSYTSSARWTANRGGAAALEIGASFRRHEDEFTLVRSDPSLYQNRHTSSQGGAELLARTVPGSGVRMAVGGEIFVDLLRSNSLGDREEGRGALFLEAVAGGGGPGVVSLGLRQDWHEGFGAAFSPALSASLRLSSRLRARMALGRSFRVPTFTERYYRDPANIGRADLDPERAWSGEVGLDLQGPRALRGSLSLFSRRATDLIDWARAEDGAPTVPWETRNVEEANVLGIEAELDLPGPLETAWTLGATALSLDSREDVGLVSKYALRPLAESVTVGVRRAFGEAFTLGVQTQRARRRGEEPYHRVDLRASLRLGSFTVYLDGTNLTDEGYPDVTGAPAPGRALHLGVEVRAGR